MPTYRTILTARGREIEAAANAGGPPIVLVAMGVGDGNGNPVTPDEAQTALVREVYRETLNSLAQDAGDLTRFIAELVVPISEGGFVMREVGLYTADNELFAVANLPDTYKPTLAEGAFSDTTIRMTFQVSNADTVELVVDPNIVIATRTWVLNSITAATIIPGGLTTQVLTKQTNADGDYIWSDPGAAVEVVVFSREETQTLAAAQTIINLVSMSSLGAAVYIEGVRLKAADFAETGAAQITLTTSYPDGTEVTVVQNEEVGMTDLLLRPNNLSDVPDKAAARANLGIPAAITSASIAWAQLTGVPAFASRWPTWTEVTDKPTTFAPSAHTHVQSEITGLVSALAGKAPSVHGHVITDVTGLQDALNAKFDKTGGPISGVVTVQNRVDSTGAAAGFRAFDRSFPTDATKAFSTYVSGGSWRLFNAAVDIVTVDSAGAVTVAGGIITGGGITTGGSVTVTGSVTASAGFQSSTERLKKNIRALPEDQATALLALIGVVEFDRRADNGHAVGVIAERLAGGPLDYVVARDQEGRPVAVDYSSLTMIALRVTQSLAQRLDRLEAMIGAAR